MNKDVEMLKHYITSLENKINDYYKMDEEYYKFEIEEEELNVKLLRKVLNYIQDLENKVKDLTKIEELHQAENGKLRTELDKKERQIRRHHREIAKGLQQVFEECLGGNDNE